MNAIIPNPPEAPRRKRQIQVGARLCNTLTRRWDDYDAYLFDIDGTLLHCRDAVHYFSFLSALNLLSSRVLELDGVTTHGNTDFGILRDALTVAGIAEAIWRPRMSEACSAMCSFVDEHRDELTPIALPGAQLVLQHLRDRGALLGVATGNLESIGRLKLEKSGLLDYFKLGAYSDTMEAREQVFRLGMALVRRVLAVDANICVFGDTPADVRAAHACGMDIIAVSTGVHSLEELVAVGPNLCLSSMLQLVEKEADAGNDIVQQCSQTE